MRNNYGDWSSFEMMKIKDPQGTDWKIEHRAANVIFDNLTDDVVIKIARDSKSHKVFSAAYWRTADFENGGKYKVSVMFETPFLNTVFLVFANEYHVRIHQLCL